MGAFGPSARLSTRPLPPAPPKLECANANHNSLKLKWADSKLSGSIMSAEVMSASCALEMENSRGQ